MFAARVEGVIASGSGSVDTKTRTLREERHPGPAGPGGGLDCAALRHERGEHAAVPGVNEAQGEQCPEAGRSGDVLALLAS